MNNKLLRIGTRESQLAIYQAIKLQEAITEHFPEIKTELIPIKSRGDKMLDLALSKIEDKGLFTKELEQAMINGNVDLAVHSLKDLPTTLPEGLELGGVLPRGEVRDALVCTKRIKMNDLSPEVTIATSSLRRSAQLLRMNPEFNITDIRGNVNTRLRKMEAGYCDVILMAAVGLQRIGLDRYISEIIDPEVIIPAVSQGAIAVEMRKSDTHIREMLREISHPQTVQITNAERLFLSKLEGGCQIPIGCYSSINDDKLRMMGFMAYVDGTSTIEHSVEGKLEEAEQLANNLANCFIEKGSADILERIRKLNSQ